MTSIPVTSLGPLSNTLHSLDLSSNLFTEIPDSLATLTLLRALNLSHCMIESLHSLTRNPLPAITALNLRANRLQSLAGIEKLYPLERLDLRNNRLTDPTELARLTGIPDIREVWVEGNPFTRTHRDYRITIFNLFRQTPGYTEDIIIDATGPSYSERRYLVERVPVPAAVPVVKPRVPEMPAVDVSKPAIVYDTLREPAVLRKERPTPKAVTSEVNTSSTRRRKTPKRRIVDLASTDATGATVPVPPIPAAPADVRSVSAETAASVADIDSNYRISTPPEAQQLPSSVLSDSRRASSQPEVPRIDTTVVPDPPPAYATDDRRPNWKESQNWSVNGEMYQRKIEALRDKVGHGYLGALNEEGWETSRLPNYTAPDFSASSTIRASPTTPRTNLQPIPSGRTLG